MPDIDPNAPNPRSAAGTEPKAAPKTAAIIVAAGRGARAGGDLPKQWQSLAGRPIAAHTLAAFETHPQINRIILVIHPDDKNHAQSIETSAQIVFGREDRAGSVLAGLEALEALDEGHTHVLIHDVARPMISQAVISEVIGALLSAPGAAPALAITDALWTAKAQSREGYEVSGTMARDGLFRAQTPQGFELSAIIAAHRAHPGGAADDVEVARAAGMRIAITKGREQNLKVTHPEDFARAERMLKEDQMDIRLGNGYDVHRFGPGDHVILCGVKIAHDQGLVGHSDADVGMHALTDAIYGALADGDIGRHFPPSDPQWKGAASEIFLAHAMERARARGFSLGNADVTLICEEPKITPHAGKMMEALAGILNVEQGRISVKATTSEQLGFTGRKEGIAAIATASLINARGVSA
ncbi:MAG: 2-C-methyl-D-erythritol 4-phosphate cytidylyltransferase [Halocynthiibacter sp.]|jgi:2-C-methyl-D-erythritol 4-phosphate cytidylyltransferase/2-C-methyl-D-erythritol 2,4-cyclodiphosphate synthase